MPNIASAKKRAKQNISKNIHNASLRSEYRTMIKKVLSLVAEGKKMKPSHFVWPKKNGLYLVKE